MTKFSFLTLSPEDRADIVQQFMNGININRLSKDYGIDYKTVKKCLKEAGFEEIPLPQQLWRKYRMQVMRRSIFKRTDSCVKEPMIVTKGGLETPDFLVVPFEMFVSSPELQKLIEELSRKEGQKYAPPKALPENPLPTRSRRADFPHDSLDLGRS